MRLHLDPDTLLTTTRAVRRRLDFERPVPRDVLMECVEVAIQGPSGTNSQGWHWIFVTDPARKRALADVYRRAFATRYDPASGDTMEPARRRVWESARYLAERFQDVPVMMIPCSQGRPPDGNQAGFWGSLLPATWSFCLAARERGLGTAWTTLHLVYERECADVLGIPFEDVTQGGLFPVAYSIGTDFKAGVRKPSDAIVHWDGW